MKDLISKIETFLAENEAKIVEEIQTLVRQNTIVDPDSIIATKPHGQNIHVGYRLLKSYLGKNKDVVAKYYTTKNNSLAYYDAFKPFGATENQKYVLFACHLDTVGFGNIKEWYLENPLSGALANGQIFGRGTVDDKGSIVMILWALRFLRENKIELPFGVRCFIGGDEEIGGSTHHDYLNHQPTPALTLVPDGEFPFSYGEKSVNVFEMEVPATGTMITAINATNISNMVPGFCEIIIGIPSIIIEERFPEFLSENNLRGTVTKLTKNKTKIMLYGNSCHAISAHEGSNAICYMFNFLFSKSIIQGAPVVQYINNFLFKNLYGDAFGINAFDNSANTGTNINVGAITLQDNKFFIKLNIRFMPVLTNADEIIKKISHHSEKFFGDEKLFNIKLIISNKGFQRNLDIPLWSSIYRWFQEISGDTKTKPIYSSGGSYARLFPNAINIGPVLTTQKYQAHCVNEKIKIKAVLTAIKYYIYILVMLGKNPKIF